MKIFKILSGVNKSVFREPISIVLLSVPFILILAVKLGLPPLAILISNYVDIYNYYSLILFCIYLMTPSLLGMVLGLLLIDEKDLDVLTYISITPFKLKNYILLKSIAGGVTGFFANLLLLILLGDIISFKNILLLLSCSLLVPYFALTIYRFSKNKIEALTRGKLLSLTLIAGVVPLLLKTKTLYFLGFLPQFWLAKIYISAGTLTSLLPFIISIAISLATIKIFSKII